MSMKQCLTVVGAAGLALLVAGSSAEPPQFATRAERPLTAMTAATSAPHGSLVLFKNSGCRDDLAVISIEEYESNTFHALPDDAKDHMSSLRWSLPSGVVVVLYENGADKDDKGVQYPIFGAGEVKSLSEAKLNDEASSWAWYRIY